MIYLIEIGRNDVIGYDDYENLGDYKEVYKEDIKKRNILESADLPYDELHCINIIAEQVVQSKLEVDKIVSGDFVKYRKVAKALKKEINSYKKPNQKILNTFYYYMYDMPIDMNILNSSLFGYDEAAIHTLNLERKYIYRLFYYTDSSGTEEYGNSYPY